MKKIIIYSFLFFCIFSADAQSLKPEEILIPTPVSMTENSGSFTLKDNLVIGVSGNDKDAARVAEQLSNNLSTPMGFQCKYSVKPSEHTE